MFPKEICLSHWLLKILMFWPKLSTYRSWLPCPSAVHLECLGWRIWNGKVCCWQQWRDGISSRFRRRLGTHHSRFFTGVIQMIIWCWLYCSCQVRYANFFFYFEGSITAELESYSQEDGYSSILEPIEDSGWLVAVTFRNGPTFLENTNSSDCLYTSLYPDWSLWMS